MVTYMLDNYIVPVKIKTSHHAVFLQNPHLFSYAKIMVDAHRSFQFLPDFQSYVCFKFMPVPRALSSIDLFPHWINDNFLYHDMTVFLSLMFSLNQTSYMLTGIWIWNIIHHDLNQNKRRQLRQKFSLWCDRYSAVSWFTTFYFYFNAVQISILTPHHIAMGLTYTYM